MTKFGYKFYFVSNNVCTGILENPIMKKCNVCKKSKLLLQKRKKTCRSCERTWGNYFLRLLVKERLTRRRIGNRLGYMGSFYNDSPYLLPYDNLGDIHTLLGLLSLPQVWL